MADSQEPARYMTSEELLAGSRESSAFEQAQREILEEIGKQLIDAVQLRQQEDWAFLAGKAVGAEDVQSALAHY